MEVGYLSRDYLSQKFPSTSETTILVNSRIIPDTELVKAISSLDVGEQLISEGKVIAQNSNTPLQWQTNANTELKSVLYEFEVHSIERVQDLFLKADRFIEMDFKLLTASRASQILGDDNQLIGPRDQLFIEEGAVIQGASLNTSTGPIYIGKNAEIMEGSLIRGPFSLGEEAVLKLGAKIYGPTVIGPHSKVGGEVSNSVIQGYSNKGHDGFLGNSILGEWCNLGADTNTSNLKNNYGSVKLWNYEHENYVDSGLTFCGLIMGDHSKCSINTMFNTGTVVGVFANIFGAEFPQKFIPSFSWGGAEGFENYDIYKAFQVAERVCARRGVIFAEEDRNIIEAVLTETAHFRS